METADLRKGHHRPWWQFNVISLAVMLFVLVWVRHLSNMSQLSTFAVVAAIVVGWTVLGVAGLSMRLWRHAITWRRAMAAFCPLMLILVLGVAVHRCRHQARLVEAVWQADRLSRGNNVVVFRDETRLSLAANDLSLLRYFGLVRDIEFRAAGPDRELLIQLAQLHGLRKLNCRVHASDIDSFAQLDGLQTLELIVEGDTDFSPLRKLKRLREMSLRWNRGLTSVSLGSLAGLPIKHLGISYCGVLSDDDVQIILALPLDSLEIRNVPLTAQQEFELRQHGAAGFHLWNRAPSF